MLILNSTGNPPQWIGIGQDGSSFSSVCFLIASNVKLSKLRAFLRSGPVAVGSSIVFELFKKDSGDVSEVSTGLITTLIAGEQCNVDAINTFTTDDVCTCLAVKVTQSSPFSPSLSTGVSCNLTATQF